jgi:tryptophan-rich hypothetical protein
MSTPLNPKKLLHSKWSAVQPRRREKHFLVTALVEPDPPTAPLEHVTLEAVLTKRTQVIAWRELGDATKWRRGW